MTAPSEKRESFVSGEVFAGRYRMIPRIGRGGMGEVWRADDLVLQTPVALKLILSNNPVAKERMVKEVRLARQITIRRSAVCVRRGRINGQVFLTMELVAGEDSRRSCTMSADCHREGQRNRPAAVRRLAARMRKACCIAIEAGQHLIDDGGGITSPTSVSRSCARKAPPPADRPPEYMAPER